MTLPAAPEIPAGPQTLRIVVNDLPLWLATKYVIDEGASIWERYQYVIMARMSWSPDTYWEITVGDFVGICDALGIKAD